MDRSSKSEIPTVDIISLSAQENFSTTGTPTALLIIVLLGLDMYLASSRNWLLCSEWNAPRFAKGLCAACFSCSALRNLLNEPSSPNLFGFACFSNEYLSAFASFNGFVLSHAWQDRQEQLTLKMPRYVRNALFQIRGTILLKGDTTVSHSRAVSILPLALLMLIAGFTLPAIGQNKASSLEDGFRTPPSSAKPRVWWHWMNGNITREGIKLDLEWMNRVGIGGFQNFDASLTTPKLVDKRLVYMTPEWKDAFRYATTLADQLGLEEAIAGSPGWSESGGPWVKPSQGMLRLNVICCGLNFALFRGQHCTTVEMQVIATASAELRLTTAVSRNGKFTDMLPSIPGSFTFMRDVVAASAITASVK